MCDAIEAVRDKVMRKMRGVAWDVTATANTTETTETANTETETETADPEFVAIVDGNAFAGSSIMPHQTAVGGDAIFAHIAAASVMAKTERDAYINALCDENSLMDRHYGLRKNKGYGTPDHLAGLRANGSTVAHRKTFGVEKYTSGRTLVSLGEV
jgi:ribonuclease HII